MSESRLFAESEEEELGVSGPAHATDAQAPSAKSAAWWNQHQRGRPAAAQLRGGMGACYCDVARSTRGVIAAAARVRLCASCDGAFGHCSVASASAASPRGGASEKRESSQFAKGGQFHRAARVALSWTAANVA